MFVVDTNVLVYAADADCEEHEQSRSLLESWRRGSAPWYVTWNIAYEFLRVTTHPRVMAKPLAATDAWAFLDAVITSPPVGLLVPTSRHAIVLAGLIASTRALRGNLLHDAHTVALMIEHGVSRIVTCDTDFHRFESVEVIDPLR